MWDVLDLLEIDYSVGPRGDAFIFAWDRDERTPSVHVNDTLWHDFGSGTGGDVISFIESYASCSFRRAIEILERQEGSLLNDVRHRNPTQVKAKEPQNLTDKFYSETSQPGTWLRSQFIAKHQLPEHIMGDWNLREGPGGALWIPHFHEGITPMVKVRDYVTGKKMSVPGSMAVGLYSMAGEKPEPGMNWVLCEGESDTWTLEFQLTEIDHEWQAVGLPSGAGKWEREWFDDMDLSKGVVCFDNDVAGERAAQQLVAQLGLRRITLPEQYNDINEAHRDGYSVAMQVQELML